MFDYFLPKSQSRSSMSGQFNPYSSFINNAGQSFVMEINKLLEPLSVKDMEQTMRKCEHFFKAIDSWKTLQQIYVTRLTEIQTTFKEKISSGESNKQKNNEGKTLGIINLSSSEMIDNQLVSLFQTLINNHKGMFQKIIYDISYVNLQTFQVLSKQIKQIMKEQNIFTKQLGSVKQQLQKVLNKKTKLRRQKQEELMLKIFIEDNNQDFMMDQKMKKHTKYNEVKKQFQQYELKVSESVEQYHKSSENLKKNHLQYYQKIDRLNECKYQTVMKMQIHLLSYYRNLVEGLNSMNKQIEIYIDQTNDGLINSPKKQTKNKIIFQKMQKKNKQNKIKIQEKRQSQFEILQKLIQKSMGYVQYSLKIIDQKEFDQLLIYSKDKQVKSKIKRMIQSNDVNPQQTDQTCRQIQLIKKIIKSPSDQQTLLHIFKTMVKKNSKLRMNFIFILQFFRLNGKFQMTQQQFKPFYSLINQFMEACHQNKDCFVLKQLMILLTTYYVILEQHTEEQPQNQVINQNDIQQNTPVQLEQIKKKSKPPTKQKIYILQFFKDHELWHDIEFWQSLLIQCIYSQKRNTIRNLVRGLQSAQKKQMLEAQKTAILNQILYVVRNMIIFDFTEKDVKNFGLRFCKLLKIDDKNLKDVYKTIEQAVKQEILSKQKQSIDKYSLKFLQ